MKLSLNENKKYKTPGYFSFHSKKNSESNIDILKNYRKKIIDSLNFVEPNLKKSIFSNSSSNFFSEEFLKKESDFSKIIQLSRTKLKESISIERKIQDEKPSQKFYKRFPNSLNSLNSSNSFSTYLIIFYIN